MFPLVPPSRPEHSLEADTARGHETPLDARPDLLARSRYRIVRDVSYEGLAGRGTRLAAVLLDVAFGAAATILGLLLFANVVGRPDQGELLVAVLLGLGPLLLCQMILLSTRGQTLGKAILGIQIVRYDNGDNPGFGRAVVLRSILPGLLGSIPVLGILFAVGNILFIFGEERRCLHDYLAGTQVVQA
jgi:uncharacterized RDD family membrane protein YckC